ncbi:hypothetical protein NM688_g6001 [Phlebia brevispora]|uniref:Uncharacterized protein n=1 Tax=Phlebia brevispora TaxID=194682 RepID=A0ACC1SLH6_9APHY|nr:hypothetical protein NM688_g6001 [Phlebia brevispora]
MYNSWRKRKTRLNALLNVQTDEDAQALALDRILHGQSVIGKTSRTSEIDELKFGDKDVEVVGTLEYGQFGVVDVVTCKIDGNTYVRKSTEKRFALKAQDQCSPQTERDVLLRALKTRTPWAPHLLCAFQSPTHLSLMMDYAEGGTLWDVLESSPHDGRILEADLLWWAPQAVSAINWCHSQDFVHRDIKPHNFVLTVDSRLKLIDFGSAAPLLSAADDGSQLVPKRYCLVPCGTCDYISPEILKSHEEALVALEMSDEPDLSPSYSDYEPGGYGRETDWWSFGAMLYEMIYGVAPFFASDIRQTYMKIMDHAHSLHFKHTPSVSAKLQDLLRRLLTTSELRLGRETGKDVMGHSYFDDIDWQNLDKKQRPDDLHLPQFVYAAPVESQLEAPEAPSADDHSSRPFSFSALFQSSPAAPEPMSTPQAVQSTPQVASSQRAGRSILREAAIASFIGFSWGPSMDASPTKA